MDVERRLLEMIADKEQSIRRDPAPDALQRRFAVLRARRDNSAIWHGCLLYHSANQIPHLLNSSNIDSLPRLRSVKEYVPMQIKGGEQTCSATKSASPAWRFET